MISEPGLTLTLYAAEPASPTAHALDLLASWTASPIQHTNTTTDLLAPPVERRSERSGLPLVTWRHRQ